MGYNVLIVLRRKLIDRVLDWVTHGTPRQAKFATRYLAFSGRKEDCSVLFDVSDTTSELVC